MSFARILRSSALLGGAQVVVLAAAIIRAKLIAVILGASGVGLVGIFTSFSGNIASFAGWGLGISGVRLIAGAHEDEKAAKVAAVRKMGWSLSLLGLTLAMILFWPVGNATFASSKYATEMMIVAFTVPCMIASSAWSAVIQSSGRVASLARVQIGSALAGLMIGVPAIIFFDTIGIALSILFSAAVPAFVLWRASRLEYSSASGVSAAAVDIQKLISIGGALMMVGWLGQISAYVVRLLIVRHEGLDAAGYYQAALAVSGSLPGFVFAAMGADFFPRVTAAKTEIEARLITESQIKAGLLLGAPLIMALLTLGKICLQLLYDNSFDAALPLLAWMTWAVFIRLVTWPMGFWLLARGSSWLVISLEASGALIGVLIPILLMGRLGMLSAAIAITISSVVYGVAVAVIFRLRTGGWFGVELHAWAIGLAFALAAGQWWAVGQAHEYAGITPVVLLAAACAWLYRYQIRNAISKGADL